MRLDCVLHSHTTVLPCDEEGLFKPLEAIMQLREHIDDFF